MCDTGLAQTGFFTVDRTENIRRVGEKSRSLFADAGGGVSSVTAPSVISRIVRNQQSRAEDYARGQNSLKSLKGSVEVCENAIRKGSTPKERKGRLKNFRCPAPYEMHTSL